MEKNDLKIISHTCKNYYSLRVSATAGDIHHDHSSVFDMSSCTAQSAAACTRRRHSTDTLPPPHENKDTAQEQLERLLRPIVNGLLQQCQEEENQLRLSVFFTIRHRCLRSPSNGDGNITR